MTGGRRAVAVEPDRLTWLEMLAAIFSGRMLVSFLMGFASGLREVFVPFVATILPAVFLLGLFTVVRLVDAGIGKLIDADPIDSGIGQHIQIHPINPGIR